MSADRTEYVLVRYDRLRHICMQERALHAETSHSHGVLELGLVLSGAVELSCNGSCYPLHADSLYIVNPYEAHQLRCLQDPAQVLTLWISPNFGRDYFPGIANMVFSQQVVSDEDGVFCAQLRQLLRSAANSYLLDTPDSHLACAGHLSNLLAVLMRSLPHKLSTDGQKLIRKKRSGRMRRIASYLDQHYKDRITLAQLAETEGLTPAYMSRVFTELFGVSFQEYLNLLRLEQAVPLVRDPSVYLMDVCMECGFSDTRYLNAVFQKAFGCSALEYRRRHAPGGNILKNSEF